jgi:hypothetical protein
MADPVSWLLIRPGWKAAAADGSVLKAALRAGRAGGADHGRRRPPVADAREVEQLGEYLEPATSAEIEPESKGGAVETLAADVRELEGEAFAPISGTSIR